MIVELKNYSGLVQIDTKGAELISMQDIYSNEFMWQKDAKYWNRCSPLLFPIVGNLQNNTYVIGNEQYRMEKHGFCRDAEFKLTYSSEEKAIFSYSYNEETLKSYPFKFNLTLTYTLVENSLHIDYQVFNMDDKPIYYCIGAHPAFNVPVENAEEKFSNYRFVFDKDEKCASPVYDIPNSEFNLNNKVDHFTNQNTINLTHEIFDQDAIVIEELKSSSVTLESVLSGRGIKVDMEGFSTLAFWTPVKMSAPFVCIEPWNGMAVRSGESNVLTEKYGVQTLDVDQSKNYKIVITPQ